MRGLCVFTVVVVVMCVNSAVVPDSTFPLDIVHYNDFHDRFEETTVQYAVCKTDDASCLGGFARLAYEVKALLKEKPHALLLNGGDAFQGTYWYTLLKWNVTQRFLNMLPHDAHAIGNHEFDDGIENVAPFLAALQAPVVAANIDISKEPSLDGLLLPYIIVERHGRKIGIIGVSTTESETSSRPGNLIFLDPIKAVYTEAEFLTEQGVDIIIVLSHCGLKVDKEIARLAGENVDIIVGGHSHSLLWNGPAPSEELVAGSYPVIVESEENPGHEVLIVQAASYSTYLGNITVYFDPEGEVVSYDAGPIFLNRSIPEDPEILAVLQPYKTELHGLVDEVVGFSNDNLDSKLCSSMECAIGDVLVDSFVDATKQVFDSYITNVGLVLRQTIRASLIKGNVTRGNIINVSPFTNKVVSIVTTGRYLWQALEKCVSVFWNTDPFISPNMPSVSGMQVTLNSTSRKVVSVLVNHDSGPRPLDLDEEYRLTVIDFLYHGGGGFNMFMNNSRDFKTIGTDYMLFENYVRKISPLNNILDNRLTIIK